MQKLKTWAHLLTAVAALSICSVAQAQGSRTYLASIESLPVRPGDEVEQFTIDTWGIDILAICSIPAGWRIEAGRTAAPDGIIRGEATHGVTRLTGRHLGSLRNIALIRTWGAVRGGNRRTGSGDEIATFLGSMRIYDSRGRGREVPLRLRNIRLVPAVRCPQP